MAPRSLFHGDVRAAGARSGNKIRFYPDDILKIFMQISKLGWVERYWDNPAAYFG